MDTESHEEVCKQGDIVLALHENSIKLLLVTDVADSGIVRYVALKVTTFSNHDVLEAIQKETYSGPPIDMIVGHLKDDPMFRYIIRERPVVLSLGANTFIAKLLKLNPSDLTPTQRHHT